MEAQKKRKKSKAQLGNDASLDILSTFSTFSSFSKRQSWTAQKDLSIVHIWDFEKEKRVADRLTIFPSIHPTDASKKH